MGENTAIEWCDHTFNLSWGCTKVSPACTNCYAETWAKRTGFDVWGPKAERRTFGEKHWREPLKWNAAAERAGVRRRVFCSSMADVFEDHPTIEQERAKLWPLIQATPWLDWLLLTKRADRIASCLPGNFSRVTFPNVWLGFTAEDQEWFSRRATAILKQPGLWQLPALWFVSAEPLLGPIDFKLALGWIGWVIGGGESGPHARPMHPQWARLLRDQCQAAGVSFLFKQHGEWIDQENLRFCKDLPDGYIKPHHCRWLNEQTGHLKPIGKGQMTKRDLLVYRLGKHRTGRLLDGREWNEFPRDF